MEPASRPSAWAPEPELLAAPPRPVRLSRFGRLCMALCVALPLLSFPIPFAVEPRAKAAAWTWGVSAGIAAFVGALLWLLLGRFVRRQLRLLATRRTAPARVVDVAVYGGRSAAAYVTVDVEARPGETLRARCRIPGAAPPEVVEGATVTALVGEDGGDIELYAAVRKYARVVQGA